MYRFSASVIPAIDYIEIFHLQGLGDALVEIFENFFSGFLLENRPNRVKGLDAALAMRMWNRWRSIR